jgi:hypothetical protein
MSPQWPSHVRHRIFAIHRMAPINIAVHDAALRKHGNRSVGLALRTKIVRQFCRGEITGCLMRGRLNAPSISSQFRLRLNFGGG